MSGPLLDVRGLTTSFFTDCGEVKAVEGVSFTLSQGEILGLVGESGSGKSVMAYSILGLVAPPGRITAGSILFQGREIVGLSGEALRRLRGDRIAMIFQDPSMTLNPVLRIGTQMTEAILAHRSMGAADARARARDMLGLVGIPSADERLDAFPHQLSGGMRQRIGIATALINEPDVVIADEPTTALDVTIQSQILYLAKDICQRRGTALIWITHDLGVVSAVASRMLVMYAGRVIEQGPVDALIDTPAHPYTAGLLASLPSNGVRGTRLAPIRGMMPSALRLPNGCAFKTRCDQRDSDCDAAPLMIACGKDRAARCHRPLVRALA